MIRFLPLKKVCKQIVDCPHESPEWLQEGITVIRNFNLVDGQLDLSDRYCVDEETYEKRIKRAVPSDGDIIFSREAPIGNCAIIPPNTKCCLGQRLVLLRVDIDVCSSEYLLAALQSQYVKQQIEQVSKSGSIVSNFNISDLKELIIPVVSQQETVSNISATLNRKVRTNKEIIDSLEAMAKSLYIYWFVQFDFPDENGKPYRTSGGEMVWNEQLKREIPKGWEVSTVGKTIDKIPNTARIPSSEYLRDGLIPVIDQSSDFIAGYTNNPDSVLESKSGYIVFGDHTRIVKYIRFPFARGADGTQVLKSNNPCIPEELFYQMIKSIDLSNYGYARHFKFLKDTLIIIPEKKISGKFAEITKPIYEKQAKLVFENIELSKLRDWLLPMLMNGQARVE